MPMREYTDAVSYTKPYSKDEECQYSIQISCQSLSLLQFNNRCSFKCSHSII